MYWTNNALQVHPIHALLVRCMDGVQCMECMDAMHCKCTNNACAPSMYCMHSIGPQCNCMQCGPLCTPHAPHCNNAPQCCNAWGAQHCSIAAHCNSSNIAAQHRIGQQQHCNTAQDWTCTAMPVWTCTALDMSSLYSVQHCLHACMALHVWHTCSIVCMALHVHHCLYRSNAVEPWDPQT